MLGKSREAILTARHVQFCRTPCTPIAPIATLPIEPFVYLVSVLLDLGISVNCSYHVIMSSLIWLISVVRTLVAQVRSPVFDSRQLLALWNPLITPNFNHFQLTEDVLTHVTWLVVSLPLILTHSWARKRSNACYLTSGISTTYSYTQLG